MDAQRGIARRMVLGLPEKGLSPAWEKDFSAYPPAGVILFQRDASGLEELRHLTAHLRELARPRRIFICIDEEGGWVSQLGRWLDVPPNALLLARGGTEEDVEWAARVTGERLRALGFDWVFAPVADVNTEPRNPVIGPRSFGSDPEHVSRMVAAAVRGYRAAGLACCLKHFPGHGATTVDSHHALPETAASRAELEAGSLVPFRDNFDAGAVMTTHVRFPALDPHHVATYSPAIVTGLLRGDLGYAGLCITDGLEMMAAAEGRTPYEIARGAFAAGCDLLLFALWDEELRRARLQLAKALTEGRLDHVRFDASRLTLAAFDRAHPEPTPEELARPIEALTPGEWRERLEGIIENGIQVDGRGPRSEPGPFLVHEPDFPYGRSLREDLGSFGLPLTDNPHQAAAGIVAVANRTPLSAQEEAGIREACSARPTLLLGLQNDAFLADFPAAVARISAADSTPLTRRVVAHVIAERLKQS